MSGPARQAQHKLKLIMFFDREKKIQDQITVSRPSGEVLSGILLQPQSQYSITGPLEKTPTKSNKEIQQVIQSSAAVWIRHAQIFTSPQSEGMRSTATRVSGWNQLANPKKQGASPLPMAIALSGATMQCLFM